MPRPAYVRVADALGTEKSGGPPAAVWTPERVRGLGVATDLRTAGSILGVKQTKAYALAGAGEFPVPAIRSGGRWVVPVAPILRLLGLVDGEVAAP